MKFKKKLLATLILTGQIYPADAALMRDDISTQVYRDFGENRGVFAAGSTNIPIYHIDGSLSGIINVMPDFSASADRGNMTLIDAQTTVTADHVTKDTQASFGKRFQQLDSTLFSGAEKESSYKLMNEVSQTAHTETSPGDYKLVRLRGIVTDAAPAELFTDTSQLKAGLQIARVGGGLFTVATGNGKSNDPSYNIQLGQGSGPTAGGLNIVGNVTLDSQGIYTLTYKFTSAEKTALDVGARSGDSGSGVWAWDNKSQSWKLMGVHTNHSGTPGYDSITLYMKADPGWTQETLNSFNDPAINTLKATDIIYVGQQSASTGEGNFTLNGKTIRYHGVETDLDESELYEEDYDTNKNLIFGGAGGTLQLTARNLDMGAGSLTFNSDYLLSDGGDSSRRMNSAGYIIHAGATVTSNLTGSAGDIWRKIGLGTLVIGGSGVNHASIYTGDGLTILQREGGHAADAMHISSGRAIVRLGAANQLDGTQVGFGTKGGVLDLYGQSLTWNDIIHMDNGATIGNSHANTLSNFTFNGKGPKTYLGNFFDGGSADKGLLHLTYAPGTAGSSWTLKGNVNTRGGMDIVKGNLAVQGALTLHAGEYIDPTQYETAMFDLGDSQVQLTSSQFTVGRNAMARGNFVLDDASSMVVTSGGALSNAQQGIDEGAYLDGRIMLSGANSVLKATPEEGFDVQVNAAISGVGHVVKSGAGILTLGGDNDFTGGLLLSAGKTIAGNLNALGAAANIVTVAKNAILELNGNSVANNLHLAGGTLLNSKAGELKLDTISLDSDSTATFNGTTDKTSVNNYLLNNHRLAVNNIKTTFAPKSTLDNGDIVFTNSNVTWSGNNNQLSSSGSLTVGKNTVLEVRDVKQVTGTNKTLVLDGGTIASGTNGNGGGSGATLRSNLRVNSEGTLNGNNSGFHINMGLYGDVSGKGTLNIAGKQGVNLYGDTSAFTGNVVLKNSTSLYLSPLKDTTLAANLSNEGSGKAFKSGDKNLTLTGDNHLYTNELLVKAGTLTFGSATAATGGNLSLLANATLNSGFDGSLGGNLSNSGTVNLTRSGTVLNVAGNYTQQAKAVLGVALDPRLGAAKLNVAGSAALAGMLKAIYAPGTYTAQTYTVLSAKKGVKGRFANVTQEGGTGITQKVAYTANNVTLTTAKSAGIKSLKAVKQDPTEAERAVQKVEAVAPLALNEDEGLTTLAMTADEQNLSEVSDVVAEPQGSAADETFVVSPGNLRAYDMQRLSLGMQKPTRSGMEQVDWSTASASKAACDTSGSCYHDDAMWITPHMSNGRLSGGNGNAKVDGISIGGYTEMGDTRLGASVDYADYDLSDSGSSASQNRYALNLFASQKLNSMVMTGSLGYTHAPTDVTRQVTSEGFNLGEGKSHLSGNAVSAGLSLNLPVQMGKTQIVPQVGIDSLNVFYSGFDEHMSSKSETYDSVINTMKVRGDSDRYDSVQPNVGVKISHELALGNTQVTPALKVTYRHELMNNNSGTVVSNDGTRFAVESDTLGRDIVEYAAGVDVKFTPRLSTSITYTGSNQQGYQSQEGMIRVKYDF